MIIIVDYGVGNIGAILNMLELLGIEAQASDDARVIASAERLLLPGVGAFDRAMSTLRSRKLVEPLNEAVRERGAPILGVCLGMQLLARRSEEGQEPGLGWIDADVVRITPPAGSALKVPHIGWMDVRPARRSALFDSEQADERYYFNHSYHMRCDSSDDVTAVFNYSVALCCAVSHGNVHGVQFHPEKSHRFGMCLLTKFATLEALTSV